MDNYIIKGAGTIDEICTALKTLSAVFGKDAKLCEIDTAKRFFEIKKIVGIQFEKGESKK